MMRQFAILFLASVALAVDYTNEAAFRSKFNSDVAVHYAAAMDNYNNLLTVLNNQLANYDPNNVQSLLKPIDPALLQSSQQFVSNMKFSSVGVNEMIKEIDAQMVALTNQISQVNAQISSLNGQIQGTQKEIQGTELQVNLATQALNQKAADLATKQRALKEAQKHLDQTDGICNIGKRKRNIFTDIVNSFGKMFQGAADVVQGVSNRVVGGVCKTIQVLTGVYQNAERSVNDAKNAFNTAKTSKDQATQQLASLQAQLPKQQVALQDLQGQLAKLGAQLNAMKAKRDQIKVVDQKMKVTLAFIDSMVARGQVIKFNVDIGYLLDANIIVVPLSEIGNVMANLSDQTLKTHVLPSLTNVQVAALKQKLDAIAAHAKGR